MCWGRLETYTFPCEARFADLDFAREIYTKSVNRHLKNGTTTCSYFATLHLDASKVSFNTQLHRSVAWSGERRRPEGLGSRAVR